MASLYKRATPSQQCILRIVEGAVRNAAHYHPEIRLAPHFVRSIAKRAAGTLTAQWPDVLAARCASSASAPSPLETGGARRLSDYTEATARRASQVRHRRSPLFILWRELAREMRAVKASGNDAKAEAYIDVLRRIAALQRAETQARAA